MVSRARGGGKFILACLDLAVGRSCKLVSWLAANIEYSSITVPLSLPVIDIQYSLWLRYAMTSASPSPSVSTPSPSPSPSPRCQSQCQCQCQWVWVTDTSIYYSTPSLRHELIGRGTDSGKPYTRCSPMVTLCFEQKNQNQTLDTKHKHHSGSHGTECLHEVLCKQESCKQHLYVSRIHDSSSARRHADKTCSSPATVVPTALQSQASNISHVTGTRVWMLRRVRCYHSPRQFTILILTAVLHPPQSIHPLHYLKSDTLLLHGVHISGSGN